MCSLSSKQASSLHLYIARPVPLLRLSRYTRSSAVHLLSHENTSIDLPPTATHSLIYLQWLPLYSPVDSCTVCISSSYVFIHSLRRLLTASKIILNVLSLHKNQMDNDNFVVTLERTAIRRVLYF